MGNCMETCALRQQAEEVQQQQQHHRYEKQKASTGSVQKGKEGIRVKILLTKEELEWFMLQLKDKEGMRLEDIFREIERRRGKADQGWKPSLESIRESPEVLEMDR
ncbi:hypothetical protein CJ030_MR4G002295 [Morella rubra]|uniref:Uncharacterized protein n=1 Tax=Morella rubra TaxID=262757 RepID=A0A6A1VRA3_9ROSI|nr:hypothetical protein CJ030_MR4G002295 [Morella rubra]